MSDKEGSDERSPTEKDTAAKKTTDDNGDRDEDTQAPSASKSCSSGATTNTGDDAPPPAESTAPTSSEASSSRVEPPASSKSTKSRAKSPIKRLGSNLLSLFGKGGSSKDPSASPRKSQPGSSGSKLFRPQSPEGQQTYAKEELDRIAEYYKQNSFLNRGVGVAEHVPFGPEVAVTLPSTTPPETSEPMDSTPPSPIDVASTVAQYPNLASIAMSQSKASSTEVAYPNLASIAKSQSEAASSPAKPKLSKAVLASSSSSSSSSASMTYSMLWSSSSASYSLTTSSSSTSLSKMASRSTVSSCLPPSPEDGVHLSTSGPQSTIVRDDSSSSHSAHLTEQSQLQEPPVRQPSPAPPTNETEEERMKRMRGKGELQK